MIDTPYVVRTKAHRAALLHITVPRSEIRAVMGPGLKELREAVSAQGISTHGPWFTHHKRMDPAVFDFEIGVFVSAAVTRAGRMEPGELPAATVARAVLYGDYEGLASAWQQLDAWVVAQGHTPRDDFWEVYLTGPETVSTPDGWRTELNQPILE